MDFNPTYDPTTGLLTKFYMASLSTAIVTLSEAFYDERGIFRRSIKFICIPLREINTSRTLVKAEVKKTTFERRNMMK